ncbi:MAG: glycosyltransferase family 2 protein [Nitrospinaceae bacterium]
MILGKKVIVVMPAYNAEKTLRRTHEELPHEYIDEVILVDDYSSDNTIKISRELGVKTIIHRENKGYGANQKTCYREALSLGADIVIMVHPDYQYSPRLVMAMASMVASEEYDIVLGSRMLGGSAIRGGMPLYKYFANRLLTVFQNAFFGVRISEYHTGFRAFTKEVLRVLPLGENSDDFVFDNEMIAQSLFFGFRIGEISCPTKYFEDASSISFKRSVVYGINVLNTTLKFLLHKSKIKTFEIFSGSGTKLGEIPPPLPREVSAQE